MHWLGMNLNVTGRFLLLPSDKHKVPTRHPPKPPSPSNLFLLHFPRTFAVDFHGMASSQLSREYSSLAKPLCLRQKPLKELVLLQSLFSCLQDQLHQQGQARFCSVGFPLQLDPEGIFKVTLDSEAGSEVGWRRVGCFQVLFVWRDKIKLVWLSRRFESGTGAHIRGELVPLRQRSF